MAKHNKNTAPEAITEETVSPDTVQELQNTTENTADSEAPANDVPDNQNSESQELPDNQDSGEVPANDAEQPETDYRIQATRLMKDFDVKEIWRCPETGYWFTKEEYANEQKKTTGTSLEHYNV